MSRQMNEQAQALAENAEFDGNEEQSFNSDEVTAGADGQAPWILGDDDNEDEFTQQQPAQQPVAIAPAQPQQPAAPATPEQQGTGFEIRSKTGHVFRGNTPQEALDAAQAHMDRVSARFGVNSNGDAYQGGNQPQQPQQQVATPPAWDDVEFFKTFANNPSAAMEMWFRSYTGMENPAAAFSKSYSTAVQVSDRIATSEFLSNNPDFPASPESGTLLVKQLEMDGADLTPFNLEVAYRKLIREGVLMPTPQEAQPPAQQHAPQQQQPQQQPQPRQQSRGAGAPPVVPARSDAAANERVGDRVLSFDEFENLSTDEMKRYMSSPAYLRSKQQGQPRR